MTRVIIIQRFGSMCLHCGSKMRKRNCENKIRDRSRSIDLRGHWIWPWKYFYDPTTLECYQRVLIRSISNFVGILFYFIGADRGSFPDKMNPPRVELHVPYFYRLNFWFSISNLYCLEKNFLYFCLKFHALFLDERQQNRLTH